MNFKLLLQYRYRAKVASLSERIFSFPPLTQVCMKWDNLCIVLVWRSSGKTVPGIASMSRHEDHRCDHNNDDCDVNSPKMTPNLDQLKRQYLKFIIWVNLSKITRIPNLFRGLFSSQCWRYRERYTLGWFPSPPKPGLDSWIAGPIHLKLQYSGPTFRLQNLLQVIFVRSRCHRLLFGLEKRPDRPFPVPVLQDVDDGLAGWVRAMRNISVVQFGRNDFSNLPLTLLIRTR